MAARLDVSGGCAGRAYSSFSSRISLLINRS
jgi:hypothetical protein